MTYTDEYFKNRQQQARIKTVIDNALLELSEKEEIYLCNLVIALNDLLTRYINDYTKDDVNGNEARQ